MLPASCSTSDGSVKCASTASASTPRAVTKRIGTLCVTSQGLLIICLSTWFTRRAAKISLAREILGHGQEEGELSLSPSAIHAALLCGAVARQLRQHPTVG